MEAPEFKRCCFCLPLRRGLIAWGYAKVGLNILMLTYAAMMFHYFAVHSSRLFTSDVVIFTFVSACLLIDISFNIVSIVAGHKKSIKLLRVSYVYHMVWLGFLTLLACFMLYEDIAFIYRRWPYILDSKYIILEFLTSATLGISLIFLQIYVILLVRSEMRKLQNQTLEMQFTNHAASGEPQCNLHNQCTDKKQIVQDEYTDEK